MRKLVSLLALILFLGVVSCQTHRDEVPPSQLLALVPPKTAVIVKSDDLIGLTRTLQKNSFINANPDLPIQHFFESFYKPLSKLQPAGGRSLLLFSRVGREVGTTLLTPLTPKALDSVRYEDVGGFTYNGEKVKEYGIAGQTIYGVKLKQLFVFGDSKLVIENIIRLSHDKLEPEAQLEKVYKSSSDKRNALFVNTPEFQKIYARLLPRKPSGFLKDFTNWAALDLKVKDQGVYLNGATVPGEDEVLGLFRHTKPGKNEIAQITPVKATGFYSFTYDDFEVLKENLAFFRNGDYPKIKTGLLQAAGEVGQIYNRGKRALVLKTKTPGALKNVLEGRNELQKTYRDHKIYSFSKPNYFYKALHPLVQLKGINFYTHIGDFFVFAPDQSGLENIIANVQNKTVLGESGSYRKTVEKQDGKSSLLLVGITDNLVDNLSKAVAGKYRQAYEKTDLLHYNFASLQFINHENYTYVNGVFEETSAHNHSDSGIQIGSIKPGEDILAGPWFFVNWRTQHYDIVFQGESNTLYAYNEDGKLRWKKQLDGKILGDIQQIDIYHNKRIQMAFVASQTFYIIDREGNVVKPFNKTFKETITQPLAIFDYNHNGRFRFIITQKNKLTMLDKQLHRVKGFETGSTKTPVLHPPKHYRIGNKDYILLSEKSGDLHILNPRGQTRVKVDQKIDFSDNDWYLYEHQFTSTNAKGELVQINQQGKVTKKKLDLGDEQHIDAMAHTLVTFSENKLTIKGKTTTLDYGLYTRPEIFYIGDKLYIAITDTQAHKVYLFDSSSNLIPGFPVYGNSAVDLQKSGNGKGKRLIVKGEDDGILIYAVGGDR